VAFRAVIIIDTPFSFSAALGFTSIFCIAVMDGVLLSFYIPQLWDEGHQFVESIVLGSTVGFRPPPTMTATVDGLGLLPAAISAKIVRKPNDRWAMSSSADALLTRVLQPDSDLPAALGLAARRRRYDLWSKPRPWTANRRLRSSPNPRRPW
jgi:hypothetical protein